MIFRILFIALFTLTMVSCNKVNKKSESSFGKAPDVTIAYECWSENKAFATFAKHLLEEHGFVVKTMLVENAYKAVLKGKADIFLDRWEPDDFYPEPADTLLPLGNIYKKTYVGLVVPNYMDINSIEELEKNKKELQDKIYAVNPDSESFTGLNVAYLRYDFTLKIEEVSETELIALFQKKYKNKEPFCMAGWFPHPMLDLKKLKVLKDPHLAFYQKFNPIKYCSLSWAKKHHKLVSVFKKLSFTESQFNVLIEKVEENNLDIDKATVAWYKQLSPEYNKIFN